MAMAVGILSAPLAQNERQRLLENSRKPRPLDLVGVVTHFHKQIQHSPAAIHPDGGRSSFTGAHLNERLGQYIGMVETDRLTDPVARLARAIASLFNPVLYPGTHTLLTVSQTELGELAGLSRQTTNAAIKQLQAAGLLSAEYGGVLVKSVESLRGYVESEPSMPSPTRR